MDLELGIIEGFYGRPWSWDEREATIAFLAPHGYRFYLYAPKVDFHLRRRWKEDHPRDQGDALARLSSRCAEMDVRFGIGLSPFEVREFGAAEREALGRKLAFFDAIGVRDLAILFDDMRGDVPDLAERQLEIVDWAAGRTKADRIIVCPSYYTDDPVLDRVFGQRPEGYIEALGAGLDPRIEIFWTGEEVCSYEFSPGHLRRVADQLRRKPFLWDNYPVNDGQRMSQFLHVRGFTGRPAEMAGLIAAHGINPALQATLTCVPALTLVERYRRGDEYEYGAATLRAAVQVMGEELATRLYEDVLILQDMGLDRLEAREEELRARWTGVDHPAAREIIAWLDGGYRITDEIVQTQ